MAGLSWNIWRGRTLKLTLVAAASSLILGGTDNALAQPCPLTTSPVELPAKGMRLLDGEGSPGS